MTYSETVKTKPGMKPCPKCGNLLPEKARFCAKCGSGLIDIKTESGMKPCPKCGVSLPERARFCAKCGSYLTEVSDNMTICPLCKNLVPKKNKICSICGTELIPGSKSDPIPDPKPKKEPEKEKKIPYDPSSDCIKYPTFAPVPSGRKTELYHGK